MLVEWKPASEPPITSLPKLVYCYGGDYEVATYNSHKKIWSDSHGEPLEDLFEVTHWMDLPQAP